jgi:hypothetical protein
MLCLNLNYKEHGKHGQAPLLLKCISQEFIQFELELNWKTFNYNQKLFLKIITFFDYFKFNFF